MIPVNFLTRYNSTKDSCECPDKKWNSTDGYMCKHMRVSSNPQNFRQYMDPDYINSFKSSPPSNPVFYSKKAELEFKKLFNDTELDKIIKFSKKRKITIYYIKSYINYKNGFNNITLYKTTPTYCGCNAWKYRETPYHLCKHQKALTYNSTIKPLKTECLELVSSVEDFNKQLEILNKEKDALEEEKHNYIENLGICLICYKNKKIDFCETCNKGLCIDCWRAIELSTPKYKDTSCPWCRSKIKPLIDILIEKFKNFTK